MDVSRPWVRWVAAAAIAVVIGLSIGERPPPGLTGSRLGVFVSLGVLLAAIVAFIWSRAAAVIALALSAMIAGGTALMWLQPDGAGAVVLFVAAAGAAMHLPDRLSVPMVAVAAATFLVAPVHGDRSAASIVGKEVGLVAFFLIARFGRSAAEAHDLTRRLLVELEAGRDAEAEAAMLRERGRLAREMHDVLAHSLSGLMLQLEGARMLSRQPNANGDLPSALDRAHHLARAGLDEARRAIAALRDEDLPSADRLERLAADFEGDSRVPTHVAISGAPRNLDPEASLALYRVAQEALTNARKHSNPLSVELRLAYEQGGTRLTVSDHGASASTPVPEGSGYGLTGMRERAELLGGRLEARPTRDGFEVELWIPA
jgi:signal transduction histidine kinase